MPKTKNNHLIYLHGWGGSKKSLQPLSEFLKKKLNKIFHNFSIKNYLIEFPGFGNTEIFEEFNLNKYCDYVFKKTQNLTGTNIFIGHSFGGKVLLYLSTHQNLSSEDLIILINSSGLKPKSSNFKKLIFKFLTLIYLPFKKILFILHLHNLQFFLQKIFYKFIVKKRDYEKLNNKPILKKTFQNIINEHISIEQLKTIRQKFFILWGSNDQATPKWMAYSLNKNISHSKLEIIKNAKHGLPINQPELCAKHIVKWIKNI